jgi:DNA polymerase IV
MIWGVGEVGQAALDAAGIRTFADLLRWDRRDLHARFGQTGERLWHLARGEDHRRVSANEPVRGISNETTFHEDTADPDILDGHIWRLSEKVADRAKAKGIAGRVVTLKLKRANFSLITRRISLRDPTQIADRIYRAARGLFDQTGNAGPYRLLGVGLSGTRPGDRGRPLGRPPRPRRQPPRRGRARGGPRPREVRPGRHRQGPGAALVRPRQPLGQHRRDRRRHAGARVRRGREDPRGIPLPEAPPMSRFTASWRRKSANGSLPSGNGR